MQKAQCAATYTAQELSVHSPTVLTYLDTLGYTQVVRAVVDFWALHWHRFALRVAITNTSSEFTHSRHLLVPLCPNLPLH